MSRIYLLFGKLNQINMSHLFHNFLIETQYKNLEFSANEQKKYEEEVINEVVKSTWLGSASTYTKR